MHWCIKFLWVSSIFAIIFFVRTYLAIIITQQPQFLPFKPKDIDSTINTCIIVDMIYVMVFMVTSFIWWRHIIFLRRRAYTGMIEEEIRAVEISRK